MMKYLSLMFIISFLDVAFQNEIVIPYDDVVDNTPKEPALPCECGRAEAHVNVNRRVAGGLPAMPHAYPWIVAIYKKKTGSLVCSGTLITNRHVLTVANCLNRLKFHKVYIALGLHYLVDMTRVQKREIRRVIIHENHTHKDIDINDIAIADMKTPIKVNGAVSPVCLPAKWQEFAWRHAIVAGWGKTSVNDKEMSTVLMEARNLTIYSDVWCTKRSKLHAADFQPSMLCANGAGGRDSCEGDTGSPLIVYEGRNKNTRAVLVGLVSWGIECGIPELPGVYTKVSHYVDWIHDNTKNGLFCGPSIGIQ